MEGIAALQSHQKSISTFNAALILLAVCFGIAGCASYQNNDANVKNVPWVMSTLEGIDSSDNTKYQYCSHFGIKGFQYSKSNVNTFKNGPVTYDSVECVVYQAAMSATMEKLKPSLKKLGVETEPLDAEKVNFCVHCHETTGTVLNSGAVAIAAAVLALISEILRRTCDSRIWRVVSCISCFTSFVSGCVSYVRSLACYNSIDALLFPFQIGNALVQKTGYGYGAQMMAGAFATMLLAGFITFMVPVGGNPAAEAAKGASGSGSPPARGWAGQQI